MAVRFPVCGRFDPQTFEESRKKAKIHEQFHIEAQKGICFENMVAQVRRTRPPAAHIKRVVSIATQIFLEERLKPKPTKISKKTFYGKFRVSCPDYGRIKMEYSRELWKIAHQIELTLGAKILQSSVAVEHLEQWSNACLAIELTATESSGTTTLGNLKREYDMLHEWLVIYFDGLLGAELEVRYDATRRKYVRRYQEHCQHFLFRGAKLHLVCQNGQKEVVSEPLDLTTITDEHIYEHLLRNTLSLKDLERNSHIDIFDLITQEIWCIPCYPYSDRKNKEAYMAVWDEAVDDNCYKTIQKIQEQVKNIALFYGAPLFCNTDETHFGKFMPLWAHRYGRIRELAFIGHDRWEVTWRKLQNLYETLLTFLVRWFDYLREDEVGAKFEDTVKLLGSEMKFQKSGKRLSVLNGELAMLDANGATADQYLRHMLKIEQVNEARNIETTDIEGKYERLDTDIRETLFTASGKYLHATAQERDIAADIRLTRARMSPDTIMVDTTPLETDTIMVDTTTLETDSEMISANNEPA